MHLIADTGKRFLPAEHGENVEDSRRCRLTGKGRSERLGNFAELVAGLVGKVAAPRSRAPLASTRSTASKSRQERTKRLAAALVQNLARHLIVGNGRVAKRKPALSSKLDQSPARSFNPGMARSSLCQPSSPIRAASAAPSGSSGTSALSLRRSRRRASRGDNGRSDSPAWRSRSARPIARLHRDRTI